jgi:hypothetical protein
MSAATGAGTTLLPGHARRCRPSVGNRRSPSPSSKCSVTSPTYRNSPRTSRTWIGDAPRSALNRRGRCVVGSARMYACASSCRDAPDVVRMLTGNQRSLMGDRARPGPVHPRRVRRAPLRIRLRTGEGRVEGGRIRRATQPPRAIPRRGPSGPSAGSGPGHCRPQGAVAIRRSSAKDRGEPARMSPER